MLFAGCFCAHISHSIFPHAPSSAKLRYLSVTRRRASMAAQAADGGDGVNVGSGGDDNTRTQLRSLDTHKQDGLRTYAAAADRNKESILAALKPLLEPLPSGSLVLEVASGTGQHAAWFAAGLPNVIWQPTEQDGSSAPSIKAWTEDLPNVRPPAVLDAAAAPEDWPVTAGSCAAVYCANVSHISPWHVTLGLVAGAARALGPGGMMLIYGPFAVDGKIEPESNRAFDQTLRQRCADWGYREVADVAAAAAAAGLTLEQRLDMPANNHLMVLRRGGGGELCP